MPRVVPHRQDIVPRRIEAHGDIPVGSAVVRSHAEHAAKKIGIACHECVWADAGKRAWRWTMASKTPSSQPSVSRTDKTGGCKNKDSPYFSLTSSRSVCIVPPETC